MVKLINNLIGFIMYTERIKKRRVNSFDDLH